ncbi:uncharacterized protein LOC115890567 isoform X2 [Sitophilus oryzae]|uniref:Uncharacterized protein LOC115890567 isoform X2 n=1 Tax=Sitophilus oryzae TaxID=7048 RepID=A0A6J2YTR6_SITOR|nr:uncharacterized protein LOC115890567 isoform X2 [Sitophilus oryzae]
MELESEKKSGEISENQSTIPRDTSKVNHEYHCLEDFCIMISVPSSKALISPSTADVPEMSHTDDVAVLEAYAKIVEDNKSSNTIKEGSVEEQDEEDEDKEMEENRGSIAIWNSRMSRLPSVRSEDSVKRASRIRFSNSVVQDGDVNCSEFVDHVRFAKEFVDSIIAESEEVTADQTERQSLEVKKYKNSFEFSYVESTRSFSSWPTVENFTIEQGAYKIDEYLASFQTEEDWLYVIYYQGAMSTKCSEIHKYQAIYSLPTWRYPIAQATASIYFRIEVCKIKPKYCPVDITFNYETFRLQHKPGVLDFKEKWLLYILDSKINTFKTVTY